MRKIIIILFALWAMISPVAATIPSHISAKFKQVRTAMMLAQDVCSTGKFTFDHPDKVTWTYDGGQTVQLPKEMLVFIRKAITGDFLAENEEFGITEKDGKTILTPKRKQLKKLFKEIHIRINNKTGVAEEVVLYEATGDVTRITFYDITVR